MSRVLVRSFGVSIDGFGAGPDQSVRNPLGVRGPEIMGWFFPTKIWRESQGMDGGETGKDNEIAALGFENMGAWILGRNMFGPVRGPWPDESWRGWWGENPPYHVPTFVLTHHPRPPLRMEGDNVFYFVTDGIQSALEQAKKAAGEKNIRIGGGTETIRQYLMAGLIDELHLAVSPVVMGSGENLFAGLDLTTLGYHCARYVQGERAMHVFLEKRA